MKTGPVLSSSSFAHALALSLVALSALACESKLEVGTWQCPATRTDAGVPGPADPIAVPWSSSFENRFCDYEDLGGFCYGSPLATYRTVTTHSRSGRHAAAFSIDSDDGDAYQTRCVRQGVLPKAAYYGAWYFIPAPATNAELWNLFHFRGGEGSLYHPLWDVSLASAANGDLELFVYDQLGGGVHHPTTPTPVPIGEWFHIQLYLERAADATGRVSLYQDGTLLVALTNVLTDDSSIGQWYVGNLANALTPAASTLYVDDVTISATL